MVWFYYIVGDRVWTIPEPGSVHYLDFLRIILIVGFYSLLNDRIFAISESGSVQDLRISDHPDPDHSSETYDGLIYIL